MIGVKPLNMFSVLQWDLGQLIQLHLKCIVATLVLQAFEPVKHVTTKDFSFHHCCLLVGEQVTTIFQSWEQITESY